MLPKNTLPAFADQEMLERPRLHGLIKKGLQYPLLVMLAGPGYGKTEAMSSYLNKSGAKAMWIGMSRLDNLDSHFWQHLTQALAYEFPQLARQLREIEFPDSLSRMDAFLSILEQSLGEEEVIWVFDDFGAIDSLEIKEFFWRLADVGLKNFKLVLMSNVFSAAESAGYMGNKSFLILSKDLRFTREEIAELCRLYKITLEGEELEQLYRYTAGWPLPLHLLLMQYKEPSAAEFRQDSLSHHMVTQIFEQLFFADYAPAQQKLLTQLAQLYAFPMELAQTLYEGERNELQFLENHIFIDKEGSTGNLSFHHLYQVFLQGKSPFLDEEDAQRLWREAAGHYAATGDTMGAVSCYRKCGDHLGMLAAINDHVRQQYGLRGETAVFFLEHLDLLRPEELEANPQADYLRALIYVNTLKLDRAEALLLKLEEKLLPRAGPEDRALLGEVYVALGHVSMMANREDFGDYYKKACDCLPEGSGYHSKEGLQTYNNHSFSMADNQPGARERMEKAVHYGVPWLSKVMGGSGNGLEQIYSAEAAYLSWDLEEAEQYAYRGIYQAEAFDQHDLAMNGRGILARIALLRGNLEEMTRQVQEIADYASRYDIAVLNEIRDTTLAWYYIKLRAMEKLPRNILTAFGASGIEQAELHYGRSQIVYANYLINTGAYAKMVGMLEQPKGLFMSSGIWPDRICLFIMLAIGYRSLGKEEQALEALWTAYDMCYHNGLITLFIEAEDHMLHLLKLAREQKKYAFDPEWLERVEGETAAYVRRVAALRAAYKRQHPVKRAEDNPLTKREAEVLQALSRGLTREEIAVEQFVSVNTVKTFIRSIYNKLNAANRAEAVSIALSQGYIGVAPEEK